MEPLIKREREAHWYLPDGSPMHRITGKNGKDRATTLRDARELDLLPSVSSIISIKAKPALEVWKQEQAILAALTLPKREGEQLDDFARRVVEDMEEQSLKARERGTTIHSMAEDWANGIAAPTGWLEPYRERLEEFAKAYRVKPIKTEQSVVHHALGYAGRVDLIAEFEGKPSLIDFKTQKVRNGKVAHYGEWQIQLVAYAKALREQGTEVEQLVSVVINSEQADPFTHLVWEDDANPWLAFKACHQLWCFDRSYYPCATSKPSAQVAPSPLS